MFKKYFLICLSLSLALLMISCSENKGSNLSNGDKIKVVVTTFPIYDWAREIIGDNSKNIELSMIIDSGVDLHSFTPSTDDIIRISNADIFIFNGGISENWALDALKQARNTNMLVLNLMDTLGNRKKYDDHGHDNHGHEEHAHHDHDDHGHDNHAHHDHGHEEHGHYDEHIWLSLINAQIFVDAITSSLANVNPNDASIYYVNAKNYKDELKTLDNEYKNTIASKENKTVIIGDRFPFAYLFDDYGLSHYAAFSGCSAETEASFDTIKFLAQKADEANVPCIVKTEGTKHKIAEHSIKHGKNMIC